MASSSNTNKAGPSSNGSNAPKDQDQEKILATWKAMAESYEKETARLVAARLDKEKKEAKVNGDKDDSQSKT